MLMDNTTSTQPQETIQPPETTKVEQAEKPAGKGPIIGMVCGLLFGVAGITFGVYGMTRKLSAADVINAMKNDEEIEATVAVVDANKDEKEEKADIVEDDSEITITNPYVLSDLNHKFAVLHSMFKYTANEESGEYLSTNVVWNKTKKLYKEGAYSTDFLSFLAVQDGARPAESWYVKWSNYEALNNYAKQLVVANGVEAYNDVTLNFIYTKRNDFIPYDEANYLYRDLTGSNDDLAKTNVSSGTCGNQFHYVASVNGYYDVDDWLGGGCGGAGYGGLLVKKEAFTAKKNEAYIYVRVLTSSGIALGDVCYVYGDYYSDLDDTSSKDLDSFPAPGNWCEFPSDYGGKHSDIIAKAQKYRFVFVKNSSGTYSFNRVEKL